jgi:MerR family transcriptional regulator, thiopeptide resistance regulator
MDVAERHRRSIERWFYPCGATMHTGLADLWEADPRFAANIDKHGAGLTAFLAAAVRANARRHGG